MTKTAEEYNEIFGQQNTNVAINTTTFKERELKEHCFELGELHESAKTKTLIEQARQEGQREALISDNVYMTHLGKAVNAERTKWEQRIRDRVKYWEDAEEKEMIDCEDIIQELESLLPQKAEK